MHEGSTTMNGLQQALEEPVTPNRILAYEQMIP